MLVLSINDFIDKEENSFKYVTVDSAIDYIQSLGRVCFLSKGEIAQVSPGIFYGYFGKIIFTHFYMGGCSSSYLFNTLPTVIEWICRNNLFLSLAYRLLIDFIGALSPSNKKGPFLKVSPKLFDKLGV